MFKFGIFDAGNAQCFVCILRQLAVLKVPCDYLASHPCNACWIMTRGHKEDYFQHVGYEDNSRDTSQSPAERKPNCNIVSRLKESRKAQFLQCWL